MARIKGSKGQVDPTPAIPYERRYFFDDGLQFECLRCGRCCTGNPGRVPMASAQIGSVAAHLNLPTGKLVDKYLYRFGDALWVREDSLGRCYFHGSEGCRVYPVRPRQCRTFPFWLHNLRSLENWRRISAHCPGIGQGRVYCRQEILDRIDFSVGVAVQSSARGQ